MQEIIIDDAGIIIGMVVTTIILFLLLFLIRYKIRKDIKYDFEEIIGLLAYASILFLGFVFPIIYFLLGIFDQKKLFLSEIVIMLFLVFIWEICAYLIFDTSGD